MNNTVNTNEEASTLPEFKVVVGENNTPYRNKPKQPEYKVIHGYVQDVKNGNNDVNINIAKLVQEGYRPIFMSPFFKGGIYVMLERS